MVIPLPMPLGMAVSESHSATHLGAHVETQCQLTKSVTGYVPFSYLLNLVKLPVCVVPTPLQICQVPSLCGAAILLLSSLGLNLGLPHSGGV